MSSNHRRAADGGGLLEQIIGDIEWLRREDRSPAAELRSGVDGGTRIRDLERNTALHSSDAGFLNTGERSLFVWERSRTPSPIGVRSRRYGNEMVSITSPCSSKKSPPLTEAPAAPSRHLSSGRTERG